MKKNIFAKHITLLLFFNVFLSSDLFSAHNVLQNSPFLSKSQSYTNYLYEYFENDPSVSQEEKDSIRPYLLPNNHPLKPILDSIFTSQRPIYNGESFIAAGFVTKFRQPRSFIRVASHFLMPDYLFKVYLDTELRVKHRTPGWQWFSNRCKNAKIIDEFIQSHQIRNFIVPKKWIYPTPLINRTHVPKNEIYIIKNEILIVEDMQLVSSRENRVAWKTKITKEHLDEFLSIIQHVGGSSYRADNVAFTRHGKFAFIDTEYTISNPDLKSILPYLSPSMAKYWKKITKGLPSSK